jgi:hypothetical protein
MLLFAKKTPPLVYAARVTVSIAPFGHITQEVANAKRQVFGTQQVWPSTKARCRAVDFLPLKAASARFPARKVFEKP